MTLCAWPAENSGELFPLESDRGTDQKWDPNRLAAMPANSLGCSLLFCLLHKDEPLQEQIPSNAAPRDKCTQLSHCTDIRAKAAYTSSIKSCFMLCGNGSLLPTWKDLPRVSVIRRERNEWGITMRCCILIALVALNVAPLWC